MSDPITLHWLTSPSASCFWATERLLSCQGIADVALRDALAGPAHELAAALRAALIPTAPFFTHLIPLAADKRGSADLATVAITKMVGSASTAAHQARRLIGPLNDLRRAFDAAVPELADTLRDAGGAIRQSWAYHGTTLLAGVKRWTEMDLLPAEAAVALVHPVGSGGAAYPGYNLVCLEAPPSETVSGLPEIVRLTWLLALLNLDLPRYADAAEQAAHHSLGRLALIPPTLAAAEEAELAHCDLATIQVALRAWTASSSAEEAAVLLEWWDVYRTLRPELPIALQALQEMLVAKTSLAWPTCV